MPINGKSKGNSFERYVAKSLSKWISNGKTDSAFWRSQSSGARATQNYKSGNIVSGQFGDICNTDPEYKLLTDISVIELKSYKDLNLWSILTDNKSKSLLGFWENLIETSKIEEKSPIMIVKQNHMPILFICNSDFSDRLTLFFNLSYKVSFKDSNGKEAFIYFFEEDILKLDCNTFNSLLEDFVGIYK